MIEIKISAPDEKFSPFNKTTITIIKEGKEVTYVDKKAKDLIKKFKNNPDAMALWLEHLKMKWLMKKIVPIFVLLFIGFITNPEQAKPDLKIVQDLVLIHNTYNYTIDKDVKRDMLLRQSLLLMGKDKTIYTKYSIILK